MNGLNISIRDLDVFNKLLNVISNIMTDERIPEAVRDEYKDKILDLTKKEENL